jgi:hypothetical protein
MGNGALEMGLGKSDMGMEKGNEILFFISTGNQLLASFISVHRSRYEWLHSKGIQNA